MEDRRRKVHAKTREDASEETVTGLKSQAAAVDYHLGSQGKKEPIVGPRREIVGRDASRTKGGRAGMTSWLLR